MTTADIIPPQRPAVGPARGVRRTRLAGMRTILALVLREMATSYGRSPGGYLWAILDPIAGIVLLSLVFSAFAHRPALGVNFPVFYATGMIPFTVYSSVSNKIANCLLFSKPLLAYSRVTFLDAILARFLTNMLTEVMVVYIIFTGLLVIYDDHIALNLPVIALALTLAGALALGVGILNCFLTSMFPTWQRVWSILMRPLFLLSCVFFLFDSIPRPFRDWLWYNPLIHLIGLMRRGFYPAYDAPYVSVGYVLGLSAVCGLIGLLFLRRYHRDILEN